MANADILIIVMLNTGFYTLFTLCLVVGLVFWWIPPTPIVIITLGVLY